MTSCFTAILFLLLGCVAVSGLDCFQCKSYKSWEECESIRNKVFCLGATKDCIKVEAKVRQKDSGRIGQVFLKGCARTCDTKDVPICRDGIDVDGNPVVCDAACCTGDFCNAGSGVLISWISLSMCAILGIFTCA
ncbi:uncharacterized protein LOC116603775 isoform X2 [Nematostella vectensis]|uniref:uncharacterized protein LOC116603775 isoform X2 n=1 Tax=Nematostella vectensis TaxID=45351 RepID=UPI0020773498|nr:uncharacterized protein LOC116603775 isoform X2 [Nematostella vectensis]